jgi:aminoglycoside 6'-N-acetyltransferase
MFQFKPLKEEDLTLLFQWFQVPHIKKWYARDQHFTFKMIKEKYLPRIDHPEITSYICYEGDRALGYIQLYYVSSFLPEGVGDYHHPLFKQYSPHKLAGIDLFMADENSFRKGYGSILLRQFIYAYVRGKFEALVVDPQKDNTAAIQFFRKNGFVSFPAGNDSDHMLMVLKVEEIS